ncbi:hypothetical protein B4144_1919 [Bacillus atrophaeus]|nr:hypothetical protein B4144_1919 [Bacillus atrophaeus]
MKVVSFAKNVNQETLNMRMEKVTIGYTINLNKTAVSNRQGGLK